MAESERKSSPTSIDATLNQSTPLSNEGDESNIHDIVASDVKRRVSFAPQSLSSKALDESSIEDMLKRAPLPQQSIDESTPLSNKEDESNIQDIVTSDVKRRVSFAPQSIASKALDESSIEDMLRRASLPQQSIGSKTVDEICIEDVLRRASLPQQSIASKTVDEICIKVDVSCIKVDESCIKDVIRRASLQGDLVDLNVRKIDDDIPFQKSQVQRRAARQSIIKVLDRSNSITAVPKKKSIFLEDKKASFKRSRSRKPRRSQKGSVVLIDSTEDESMVDAFYETVLVEDDEDLQYTIMDNIFLIFLDAIDPDFMWVKIWKLIALAAVLLSVVVDTFLFGYAQFFDTYVANTISNTCDLIFVFHIYLTFRFGFWCILAGRWTLCLDSKVIAKKYLMGWFIIDAVSVIPFNLFIDGAATKFAGLVLIPRLLRFRKIFENKDSKVDMISGLVYNLLAYLLLSHLVACALAYIDDNTDADEECHRPFQELYFNIKLSTLYVSMLAYSGRNIGDLGSGNVSCTASHSTLELFTTIVGMMVFATIISNIDSYVSYKNLSNATYLSKRQMLMKFMDQHGVSQAQKNRCEKALNFAFINREADIANALNRLPEHIRGELQSEMFTNYINCLPCYRLFTDHTKLLISQRIHTAFFLPNAKIVSKGEVGNRCYIFMRGKALCGPISFFGCEDKYLEIGNGDFFGEEGLILDDQYTYECDLHTISYCEVGILKSDAALQALQYSTRDQKVFSTVKRYAKNTQTVKDQSSRREAARKIQKAWKSYVRGRKRIGSEEKEASLAASMTLDTNKLKLLIRKNSTETKQSAKTNLPNTRVQKQVNDIW